MVVAFDFDGCLSTLKMQRLCRLFIMSGAEVWVVSRRRSGYHNRDMWEVIDMLQIHHGRVILTDDKEKFDYIEGMGIDLYIDNEMDELTKINRHSGASCLLFINE